MKLIIEIPDHTEGLADFVREINSDEERVCSVAHMLQIWHGSQSVFTARLLSAKITLCLRDDSPGWLIGPGRQGTHLELGEVPDGGS